MWPMLRHYMLLLESVTSSSLVSFRDPNEYNSHNQRDRERFYRDPLNNKTASWLTQRKQFFSESSRESSADESKHN